MTEAAPPFEAVLFDFHCTLVDQGDAAAWIELAWRHDGRAGSARDGLGPALHRRLAALLDRVWEHAAVIDPGSERDLSPARHRAVYDALMARQLDGEAGLRSLEGPLYEVMLDLWTPYDDAAPTLSALRARGLRTAVLSNVGLDIRPVLERGGLAPLVDAVVLSYEVGAVKPQPALFQGALAALGVAPERALMVGDNPEDDAGAARLGVRTLLLPRTRGRVHGLELVLRLVGDRAP